VIDLHMSCSFADKRLLNRALDLFTRLACDASSLYLPTNIRFTLNHEVSSLRFYSIDTTRAKPTSSLGLRVMLLRCIFLPTYALHRISRTLRYDTTIPIQLDESKADLFTRLARDPSSFHSPIKVSSTSDLEVYSSGHHNIDTTIAKPMIPAALNIPPPSSRICGTD
jgi:hypothetical protein